MKLTTLGLVLGIAVFSTTAYAQSAPPPVNIGGNTATGTGTSNVSTNSNQNATSSNAGVTAAVNQYGATHMNERLDAQVPLALSGYGSFSQSNCANSLGVGATTRIFSFVFNAPKANVNCQQIVMSNAWGAESQLARNEGKPIQAELMRATSVWQLCQISKVQKEMCIREGLIVYVDPKNPKLSETLPNPQFAETAQSHIIPPVAVGPQMLPSQPTTRQ